MYHDDKPHFAAIGPVLWTIRSLDIRVQVTLVGKLPGVRKC